MLWWVDRRGASGNGGCCPRCLSLLCRCLLWRGEGESAEELVKGDAVAAPGAMAMALAFAVVANSYVRHICHVSMY